MDRVKLRIDRRLNVELPVSDVDPATGEVIAEYDKVQAYDYTRIPELGGWDVSDPGVGRAVLLPDGSEVLNPVPMAPPVGFKEEPSMMEVMQNMIKRHMAGLEDDTELDTPEDALDFDVPDDHDPWGPYEVELMEEFPAVPKVEESGDLDKEEEAPPPPPKKKKAAKPPPVVDEEEGA